jgi:hypothetical protein
MWIPQEIRFPGFRTSSGEKLPLLSYCLHPGNVKKKTGQLEMLVA